MATSPRGAVTAEANQRRVIRPIPSSGVSMAVRALSVGGGGSHS